MVNLLLDVEEGLERYNAMQYAVAAAVTEAVKQAEGPEKVQIGLLVVGDETMRDFNLQHRGVDKTTDVLSFPMLEPGQAATGVDIDPDTGEVVLGDIVISLPAAERQAREYGHGLARELSFLGVHGALHLLGRDHDNDGNREAMRALEEAVLLTVGQGLGESVK